MKTIHKFVITAVLATMISPALALDAFDPTDSVNLTDESNTSATLLTYENATDENLTIQIGSTIVPPAIPAKNPDGTPSMTPFTQLDAIKNACGPSIASNCEIDYYANGHQIANVHIKMLNLLSASIDDPAFSVSIRNSSAPEESAQPIEGYKGSLLNQTIKLFPANA